MDILVMIAQFVVSFSLLVIVHELGHFTLARIFGVRVDAFQLFFGRPVLSVRRGETKYGIGWIPFGGFVKLAGMVDESFDMGQMAQAPRRWEFRSKPAWQRLLIMCGGVFMNVVLAFLIYTGMSYTWGDKYLSTADVRYGYVFSEQGHELGFRDGDRIVSIDGAQYDDIVELTKAMILSQQYVAAVERDGQTVEFRTPAASVMKMAEEGSAPLIMPRYPFTAGGFTEGSAAAAAGIVAGDRLRSLDGKELVFFDEWVKALADYKGRLVEVGFLRDSAGMTIPMTVTVDVSAEGKIGVRPDSSLTPVHYRHYTFWQSFPAGIRRMSAEIGGYWKQMTLIFKPKTEAYKSVGGPLSIVGVFPRVWDWLSFWNITALLSIVLAVMNILPIPILDGGHVLFLLFEMITGRKPGDRFLMYAQMVGLALLVALMIYATGNDIRRLL